MTVDEAKSSIWEIDLDMWWKWESSQTKRKIVLTDEIKDVLYHVKRYIIGQDANSPVDLATLIRKIEPNEFSRGKRNIVLVVREFLIYAVEIAYGFSTGKEYI